MLRILLILMAYICCFSLSGNDLFLAKPSLRVDVRLLKHVYRINRPIPVYVTVINQGPKPVVLSPSLYLYKNYRFRVRTLRNIIVKHRNDFYLYMLRTRNASAVVRTIKLMPGERYGRVIDLARRMQLFKPGHYEVTGYFYIHPMRTGQDFNIKSNSVRFMLKPPLLVQRDVKKYQNERKRYLSRRLSAGETVDFMIRAKRRRDWESYFQYMDLEKMINVFQQFSKRYATAAFTEKQKVLQLFKEYLKRFPSQKIERHFVSKTTVTVNKETRGQHAEVKCEIVYRKKRLIERKVYYFSLYRRLDRWYIYKYYVLNK